MTMSRGGKVSSRVNNFNVKTLRKRRQSLDEFDRLPRWKKEIVWYLPFKAAVAAGDIPIDVNTALAKFSEDTARVYGWEHPGAELARRAKFKHSSLLDDIL